MYAKNKIEKLMAVANHPTTNENEAQSAYNMAKKVAEKYKVLTWFFLTYESKKDGMKENIKKQFSYDLTATFRWIDITNTVYKLLKEAGFTFETHGLTKRSLYYSKIILIGTEKQFEFSKVLYNKVLKAKNRYCRMVENHSMSAHKTFSYLAWCGFCGINTTEKKMDASYSSMFAYNFGIQMRKLYEEESKGW